MKTLLWYWPFASSLLLFLAFALGAVISVAGRTGALGHRNILHLTAICFGSLAFHYLWGCILTLRPTFDFLILPLGVTRALYIVEIFAVLIAAATGIALARSLLASSRPAA